MARKRITIAASLLALLVLAWLIYSPGLSGPFLFDDYGNLPALGASGPVDNAATFARYITSGTADPTGRPIALLSFLIDAHDWPTSPEAFKRTNVLLHLLNGSLLFWLLCCLGKGMQGQPSVSGRNLSAALLGAALWLLHPLFVSTTLYIVQREAMLPATFTLLGLLGWWHGRRRIDNGNVSSGVLLSATAVGLCTLLGVLSKANGALLPVYVLVLEYMLPANGGRRHASAIESRRPRSYRMLVLLPCWVGAGLIAAYLGSFAVRALYENVAPFRPWTLGQRLLTEPRIVWEYLRLLWIPRPYSSGVFNDQISVSTGLFAPWTTFTSIVAMAALIVGAVGFRRRAPAWCVAIVFFLCGHAIESTSLPLELYFEHRNYVPALLMFWPLGRWLAGADARDTPRISWRKYAAAGVILVTLSCFTFLNAQVWGDSDHQALLWARLNPQSNRAQVNAATTEMLRGDPQAAERRLRPLATRHPDQVQLAFNLVAARCAQGSVSNEDLAMAEHAIGTSLDPGTLLMSWFARARSTVATGNCRGLDDRALRAILDAGMANPHFPTGRQQDLVHLMGTLELQDGHGERAAAAFDKALALEPRCAVALEQAAELGSHGYPGLGLRHLATFDKLAPLSPRPPVGMARIHAWILERQKYWVTERARLEATLREDMRKIGNEGSEH